MGLLYYLLFNEVEIMNSLNEYFVFLRWFYDNGGFRRPKEVEQNKSKEVQRLLRQVTGNLPFFQKNARGSVTKGTGRCNVTKQVARTHV